MDTALAAQDARQLTDRIKVAVEGTWLLIQEAYASRVWAVLGYDNWDEYCATEFGHCRLKLPREERQQIVTSLRDAGFSTRAIASATGVNRETVRQEASAPDRKLSPAAPIVGLDGKTYSVKPQPIESAPVAKEATVREELQPLVEGFARSSPRAEKQAAQLVAKDRAYARELVQAINTQLWRTRNDH